MNKITGLFIAVIAFCSIVSAQSLQIGKQEEIYSLYSLGELADKATCSTCSAQRAEISPWVTSDDAYPDEWVADQGQRIKTPIN